MKKLVILTITTVMIAACTQDTFDPPETFVALDLCDSLSLTYDDDVKRMLDVSCGVPGCHAPGGFLRDLTNFQGVQSYVFDGKFEDRVLDKKDMPPPGANVPALTAQQLDSLNCWLRNDAPEN